MAPGDLDTYWSGTAPICVGGCKGKHKELKRSQCGNGSCCWLGYKSFCRVNCGRPEADFNSVVYGNDWWVGSVVRYSCRPGFMLLGDPASACQSDGRWTPKPTCLREYHGVGWYCCSISPPRDKRGWWAQWGCAPVLLLQGSACEVGSRSASGTSVGAAHHPAAPRATWEPPCTVAASRSPPAAPNARAGCAGSCAAMSVSVTATCPAGSPDSGAHLSFLLIELSLLH
ncbi:sushi, von Willebrand factor type A, EGF and pentraxin domain-containing protein 1-like isoform X1 [Coturnix japonica]|uniref:sushi, von Willebrand factor type A, EGF and pentraxin domain-containing protein 1-like isoform X1 n=1 Tax=Coturnix japonica TaxID=93934 RepID=UPI0013A5EF28|nr:sushi, von Willebrand factor type A, EGF and pentraxin domain-containing protein 1-like isoform X1 [Coturnix japonica]